MNGYDMVGSSAPTVVVIPAWLMFVYMGVCVLLLVSMWKVFAKAGFAGWKCLIPFYNVYVEFQIVYGKDKGWKMLLLLIPFYNIYVSIKMLVDMAKCYGKSGGFAVGLVLLSVVFMPMLAFGDAKYVGPVEK